MGRGRKKHTQKMKMKKRQKKVIGRRKKAADTKRAAKRR